MRIAAGIIGEHGELVGPDVAQFIDRRALRIIHHHHVELDDDELTIKVVVVIGHTADVEFQHPRPGRDIGDVTRREGRGRVEFVRHTAEDRVGKVEGVIRAVADDGTPGDVLDARQECIFHTQAIGHRFGDTRHQAEAHDLTDGDRHIRVKRWLEVAVIGQAGIVGVGFAGRDDALDRLRDVDDDISGIHRAGVVAVVRVGVVIAGIVGRDFCGVGVCFVRQYVIFHCCGENYCTEFPDQQIIKAESIEGWATATTIVCAPITGRGRRIERRE